MENILSSVMWKFRGIMKNCVKKILNLYRDRPIRTKFMIMLNVVILIPLIIISFVCFKNSENELRNKSIQYSQDILKIINLRLNDYASSLDNLSLDLLNNALISDYVKKDENEKNLITVYHDQENIREYFRNQITTKGEAQSISIFVGGRLHCYADDSKHPMSIENIVSYNNDLYKKLLKEANANGGAPVWYFDSSGGKVNNILYVRAVIDRDTYNNRGLLIIMVNKNWFNTVFDGLVNEDMKKTAVLSPGKEVILSKSGAEDYPLSNDLFSSMSYDCGWVTDESENTLITYLTVKNTNWKIISYIPLSVLFSDIEELKQRIILVLAATVLFLLLISFFMSYDFVSSINKLVYGMAQLQKGNQKIRVNLERKDELGFLGNAFNTMVKEITTLQKWVLREKLTRKDAQIKALQSQINPHFLFNTLETINWMAMLNQVPEISETVTALSSLMEVSMARDGAKCITLEEEINYIDNYMLILKKRFGERLELIKDIDKSVLQLKIPRLIVQPLIENAANHGVAEIRGKGVIRLVAAKNEDCVDIKVEDNGSGIGKDELEMINERLSMNDEEYFKHGENSHSNGIGLENVNRRIKLFYGAKFGIKIESELGSYTRIIMKLPLETTDKIQE
jgi:two-component system sensor histidine kinase YesM